MPGFIPRLPYEQKRFGPPPRKPTPPKPVVRLRRGGQTPLVPRKPAVVAAHPRAPIKAPLRPAGKAGKATARTIPAHATTPARASRTLTDRTPAAKARAPIRPRPQRTLPPAGPAVDTQQDPYSGDQQLLDAMLAPQYQQIDAAETRQTQMEAQRTALIQSLTGEMMSKLGTIAPAVAQDYNQAVSSTAGLAREGMQALAAASPNAQIQSDLSAIGAPAEQQAQIATQNQNVFQGGGAVLFQRQGVIPGSELAAHGAAQTAFSRNLPGIAGLQGLQAFRSFQADADLARQGLADQRGQINAKIPSLLMDIQAQRASQAAKDRALQLEEVALGLRTRGQLFNEKATTVRLGQGATSLKLRALQGDRSWQATLRRLGISEASLSLRAAQAQAKMNDNGFTKSQILGLRKRAGQVANDAFNGVPVKQGGEIVGYNHTTYQHAMSNLLAQGIPLTVAQQALNTYWSKPGLVMPWEIDENGHRLPGAGRPLLSYQQRTAGKPKKR